MNDGQWSRRDWIRATLGAVGWLATSPRAWANEPSTEALTFGIFTDCHYADREPRNTRFYRDSLAKVERIVAGFNSRRPAFVVHLGDFVDKGETVEEEFRFLTAIDSVYDACRTERYYVLGNHDVATFSKRQFLDGVGAERTYLSFDRGGFHFVLLDACYNEDESDYDAGNFDWTEAYIPAAEREWLADDLTRASKPTIVFVHQRLDDETDPHGVKNAPLVREILEASKLVRAVFQGHDHRGGYAVRNGIHYVTLKAVVEGPGLENNGFALVTVDPSGSVFVQGFGKEPSRELSAPSAGREGMEKGANR